MQEVIKILEFNINNPLEVREFVLAGLEQIKEGKTKDFNTVCDRLEKKYRNETVSN